MQHDPHCIFCKIVAGQIPCRKIHEDDDLIAFHDINPAAPVHFLIVPKAHIASLATAQPGDHALLGRLLGMAAPLAAQTGASNGFKTVINTGHDGGQEVHHLHVHVLGGARPWKHSPGA